MNNYGYMMPNMPNYYPAPFSRQVQGQPLPPPQMEVIVVHGQGGADAFQMGPNSSVLLLDDTAPVVWLKKTGGAGYATLIDYDITKREHPAGSYNNGEKYCIVIAQSIPAAATINAPVVVTIGSGTTQYPLVNRCCAQVTACAVRTRTKYATVVSTTPTGGTFRLLGRPACAPNNNLQSISGGAAASGGDTE